MKTELNANPFVFVVGCPRSGTTLLQRMLDHHPLLAVANDTHFIPRVLHKAAPHLIGDAVAGRAIPLDCRLIGTLLAYHRLPRLELPVAEIQRAAVAANDYADWISRIYDRYAERADKPCAGEKTPDYVRHLPLLHGLFPGSRFLHILRDGRDVALSVLQWAGPRKGPGRWDLWQRDSIGAIALWWRHQVQTGLDDAGALPQERYASVSYEALVARPEVELRQIARFLGLTYSDEMLQFHRGKMTSDPQKSAKSNWLPPTKGLRDWRTQMAPEDIAVFQRLAGKTLEATGYELVETGGHEQSIGRRVTACLDWWEAFRAKRKRKAGRRLEISL